MKEIVLATFLAVTPDCSFFHCTPQQRDAWMLRQHHEFLQQMERERRRAEEQRWLEQQRLLQSPPRVSPFSIFPR